MERFSEMEDYEKKNFCYHAIFIPKGVEPPERSIIEQPELALYYEDFGIGKADNCLVAEIDGKVVGAVWTRKKKRDLCQSKKPASWC